MGVCLDEVPLNIRVAIAKFTVHSEEGVFGQSNITCEDRTVKDRSKSMAIKLTFFAVRASINKSNGNFTSRSLDDGFLFTHWVLARDTIDGVGIELDLVQSGSVDFFVIFAQ
jgi:hypothetical protein